MFFIPACPFRTHNAVGQIKHAYTTVEKSAVLTGAGRTSLLQISEKGKISMGYTGDYVGNILQRKGNLNLTEWVEFHLVGAIRKGIW